MESSVTLPLAPEVDHDRAKVILDLDTGDARYDRVYQYGQIIYAPRRVASWYYASLYEATSLSLLGDWTHEPMNGRMKRVKQCARALSRLTNWPEIVAQAALLPHDVSHALIEQVNGLVREAGGRPVMLCRECSERLMARFRGPDD